MNNVIFKHKSLRATIIEALDYIGVDIDDFNLKAEYFDNKERNFHDPRHLYRVMLNCALIALETKDSRRGFLAFCGGFIHDLALKYDGGGCSHGQKAVDQKWHLFADIWDKYKLSDKERDIVKAAVVCHCGGNICNQYKEDYIVNAILHSADAFDRARFYSTEARLDISYIKHPKLCLVNNLPNSSLLKLIGESEALWCFTKDVDTYLTFREFISYIR